MNLISTTPLKDLWLCVRFVPVSDGAKPPEVSLLNRFSQGKNHGLSTSPRYIWMHLVLVRESFAFWDVVLGCFGPSIGGVMRTLMWDVPLYCRPDVRSLSCRNNHRDSLALTGCWPVLIIHCGIISLRRSSDVCLVWYRSQHSELVVWSHCSEIVTIIVLEIVTIIKLKFSLRLLSYFSFYT